MSRDKGNGASPESVISIIGPGMRVVGDCETDGTIRIEGTVEGEVSAGKAVVIGKQGMVKGSVNTQDAVIAGKIQGALLVESRLELQSTSRIEGDVYARRLQLEEGAILNGTVDMGEKPKPKAATSEKGQPQGAQPGGPGRPPTPSGSGQPQGGSRPAPPTQGGVPTQA